MSSVAGARSIPDAFLLDVHPDGKMYLSLVEHELGSHNPRRHVREQIFDFEEAMDSERTRRPLVRNLYDEIQRDKSQWLRIKNRCRKTDPYAEIDSAVNEHFGVVITVDSVAEVWTKPLRRIADKHEMSLYEVKSYYPVNSRRKRKLKVGEQVMALYPDDDCWYSGRVTRIRKEGWTVKWNEGSSSLVMNAVPLGTPVIRVAYQAIKKK